MSIKKEKFNSIVFWIYLFTQTIILIFSNKIGYCKVLLNSSVFLIINFVLLFLFFFINIKTLQKDRKKFYFLFMCIAAILVSCLLNNSGLGSIINIINLLLGFYIFSSIKLTYNPFYFKLLFLILLFGMIFNSLDVWNAFIAQDNALNPNTVGFLLFYCYSIFDIFFSKAKKITKLIFTLAIIYFIYLTNCRTAILLMIIYVSLSLLVKNKKNIVVNKKIKHLMIIIVILGIILPYFYVKCNNVLSEITLFNKNIYTGREKIWESLLFAIINNKTRLFLGFGSNYILSIGKISNYHNWYLGNLFCYGIVNYVLIYSFIIKQSSNITNYKILATIFCVFVMGLTETSLMNTQIQFLIFFLISCNNYVKEEAY